MTTFHEYSIERWGPNWALCRATPANKAHYGRCVSRKEMTQAEADWRAEFPEHWLEQNSGDPAAAVAMYRALQAVEIPLAKQAGQLGNTSAQPLLDLVRAAIAKAKGQ